MRTPEQALSVAQKVIRTKFPSARLAFCAGSIVRSEGTETSDIDLVVLFEKLEFAWRESFVFEGWPVEAFVHDPATLRYFFDEMDVKSGVPALPQMVSEGLVVCGPSQEAEEFKKLARQVIAAGPPKLTLDEIRNLIYGITDLVDDLRAPRSREEAVGTGARLYSALGSFILRSKNRWAGDGKQISRALRRELPEMHEEFTSAFENLFTKAESTAVIKLAEKAVAPHGGLLFDRYRRDAPASWRK